jgi:hypothetical protein
MPAELVAAPKAEGRSPLKKRRVDWLQPLCYRLSVSELRKGETSSRRSIRGTPERLARAPDAPFIRSIQENRPYLGTHRVRQDTASNPS